MDQWFFDLLTQIFSFEATLLLKVNSLKKFNLKMSFSLRRPKVVFNNLSLPLGVNLASTGEL
jgi:hypothetical protein